MREGDERGGPHQEAESEPCIRMLCKHQEPPCHRPSLSLSPFLTLVLTLFKRITLKHSMYEGDGTGPIVEDALRWLERESI